MDHFQAFIHKASLYMYVLSLRHISALETIKKRKKNGPLAPNTLLDDQHAMEKILFFERHEKL